MSYNDQGLYMKPKNSGKRQVTFYLSEESVAYLKKVAFFNDRSVSQCVDRVLNYVIEKHQTATTGDRTSLDLLQVLGPAPDSNIVRHSDSGLLQQSALQAEEGVRG